MKSGTMVLLLKNTIVIVTHKYMLHKTPNNELNLSALIFLGMLIGNKMVNAKMRPQKRFPASLLSIQEGRVVVSLSMYISMM